MVPSEPLVVQVTPESLKLGEFQLQPSVVWGTSKYVPVPLYQYCAKGCTEISVASTTPSAVDMKDLKSTSHCLSLILLSITSIISD